VLKTIIKVFNFLRILQAKEKYFKGRVLSRGEKKIKKLIKLKKLEK
jgi:hypothetical protein